MAKTMCALREFTKRLSGDVPVVVQVGDVTYDIYQMHKIQTEESCSLVLVAEQPRFDDGEEE